MNDKQASVLLTLIALGFVILVANLFSIKTAHASETWTKTTYALEKHLVKVGVSQPLASHIITMCKQKAKNPRKCVATYVALYGNESSFWRKCKDNACWGRRYIIYTSPEAAFDDWLIRYNKYWYTHNWGVFFYGWKGFLGRSGFCTEEHSSNSKVGCPNWARIFDSIYKKVYFFK